MLESDRPEIRIFPDLEQASEALAKEIAFLSKDILRHHSSFTLALSGGKTPDRLYQIFGERYAGFFDWSGVHLFFSDERVVPFTHQESNYALVNRTLLQKIPIPRSNIHPMPVDIDPPQKAAEAYDRDLRAFFGCEGAAFSTEEKDTFDVMVLGLGEDGHTASLFPESDVLEEEQLWVKDVQAPETVRPRKRLTLTYPVINKSKYIFLLVAGKNKRGIVQKILKSGRENRQGFPAEKIKAVGKISWYLDREAAGSL